MPVLRKAEGGSVTPVAERGCGGPIVTRGRERHKGGGGGVLHPGAGPLRGRAGAWGPSASRSPSAQGHLMGGSCRTPQLYMLLTPHRPFVENFRAHSQGIMSPGSL